MRRTFLHVSFSVRRTWFWQLVASFKNTPTPHTCSSPVLVTFCRGEHTNCDSDSRSQGGLGTWRMNDCIKHWSAENVFISEICLFTWVKLQFIWLCHSYFLKMCFFFDPVLYLFFLNVKFLNLGRRQITKPCRSKPVSSGIIIFFPAHFKLTHSYWMFGIFWSCHDQSTFWPKIQKFSDFYF